MKNTRDYILEHTKDKNFKGLDDVEIYNYLCDTFYCKDHDILRKISFELFYRDNKGE